MRSNTVRGRSTTVTLENLVNRLKTDQKLLVTHPENKDLLERRIKRHAEEIIRCVMKAHENGYSNIPFNMVIDV